MPSCPQCGEANPHPAKFCSACGTALAAAGSREARKTVTVLFSDMVGSTALGDRLDPEAIRRIVSRYFEAMERVLEHHGGTVEKFIGDAIMAVFGIPNVREDDALRALRAAIEMRERLQSLNDEFDSEWGVRLHIRTGVNTGEVVAGDPSRGQAFVSGDTVNVAARLEQAAGPDQILIGERTWTLGAGAIEAEPVESLTLKGKPEQVPAWRLLGVSHGGLSSPRRGDGPFIGRREEIQQLGRAFERAVQEQVCVLATVVGPPGIGKSRLSEEFTSTVGQRARVVTGQCLSYGEGITYWPLAEIVNEVGGDNLSAALAPLVGEDASVVADRIAAAVGSGETPGSPAEIFWAFRKLFEGLARERPLIVLIDDLHWAEPTLLDLLEYVIGFASGAPMLLLCLARAELFESRPSWAVPRQNASLVPLQPISEADAGALIEELVTREFSADARFRVAQAAEGNPLFIEQLLALNADASNGSLVVPPTIQALLAARIDGLGERDRAVIERASIEGRSFHRSAVSALLDEPGRATVGASLISLGRKEFIQPDQALFSGDDAFRFGHILIRDAAYEAVPKQVRAELHERFANWLELMADGRIAEFEEILGYHLEQAHRYQGELGRSNDSRRLAELAGQRLARAGLRAQARGDMPATRGLLSRAASLLPPDDSQRLLLLPELAAAFLDSGDLTTAAATLQEAEERAKACGNELAVWRATIGLIELHCWSGAFTDALIPSTKEAQAACTRLGDELGLARAWLVLGLMGGWFFEAVGTILDSDKAFQQALVHARLANARREESAALRWLIVTGWFGPMPATEGIRRCNEILELPTDKSVEATALIEVGCFLATQGKFDEARSQFDRGYAMIEDLGQELLVAGSSQELFDIEMLAGNPAAAERRLRTACETLEQIGERGFLATRLGCLAEAIYAQGRHAEAEEMSRRAESASVSQTMDIDAQYRWRAVRGKVLAQRGEYGAAEALVREAVELIARTNWLNARAGVHLDLAEVLELAGRRDDANHAIADAMRLFEAKENVVAATSVRERLAQ